MNARDVNITTDVAAAGNTGDVVGLHSGSMIDGDDVLPCKELSTTDDVDDVEIVVRMLGC